MKSDASHEYLHFMKSATEWLAQEYARIQKRTLEDPGTAGDQAEENWASLLRNWLPATYPVVTKGRIISAEGNTSPQVDIIILQPWYPVSLRDKKLYFAGGVVAAFECKLTLRTTHLKKCLKNAFLVKSLTPKRHGTPYDELHQPIIYGLLAHSHEINTKKGNVVHNILEKIQETTFSVLDGLEEEAPELVHPAYMMDIICIANTATIAIGKSIHPEIYYPESRGDNASDEGPIEVETGYIAQSEDDAYTVPGQILGSLINDIIIRLAFEDPSLQAFADYLLRTSIWGGIGPVFVWKPGRISKVVLKQLKTKHEKDVRFSKWSTEY